MILVFALLMGDILWLIFFNWRMEFWSGFRCFVPFVTSFSLGNVVLLETIIFVDRCNLGNDYVFWAISFSFKLLLMKVLDLSIVNGESLVLMELFYIPCAWIS